MPRHARRALTLAATVASGAVVSDAGAIDRSPPPDRCGALCRPAAPPLAAPPTSVYDFLVRVGILPVPGYAEAAAIRGARCANPEAAAEAGDCPPAAARSGGGGGGRPAMRMMG